jgi:hypothetical protein
MALMKTLNPSRITRNIGTESELLTKTTKTYEVKEIVTVRYTTPFTVLRHMK